MAIPLRVFVYGTLKPGECNYPLYCQGKTLNEQPVYTYGRLYDLNLGYPGMTVGDQKVYGYLLVFSSVEVLADLDQLETYDGDRPSQENEYDRCLVDIYDLAGNLLEPAWGYLMRWQTIQRYEGMPIPSGIWSNPHRPPMYLSKIWV